MGILSANHFFQITIKQLTWKNQLAQRIYTDKLQQLWLIFSLLCTRINIHM